MLIGVAAMASAQQPANQADPEKDQKAKPGIGGVAMQAVSNGAMGGPIGAGLVSQGPKLTRAMFGRKYPAKPAADAPTEARATADAATASSGSN